MTKQYVFTARDFRKAAALVRQGWAAKDGRKVLDDGTVCYCALGALAEVKGAASWTDISYALNYGSRRVKDAITADEKAAARLGRTTYTYPHRLYETPGSYVIEFNDSYTRGKEPVAQFLERVADRLETT